MLSILGVGNRLRGDDGIGPEVVHVLQTAHDNEFSEIMDVGSDAMTILEKLLTNKPVLVIDCARMGLSPGSIRRLSACDAAMDLSAHGLSLHGFTLAEVWQMARAMGVHNELIIIGVQPEKIEFNTGLSQAVRKSIPAIIYMVREEAKKYAS